MNKSRRYLASAVILCLSSISTFAFTEVDITATGSGAAYDSHIQTNDLLTNAVITTNGVPLDFSTHPTGINDGSASSANGANNTYFGNGISGTDLSNNPVLTFNLNLSALTGSPLGYDLTQISSIYGWNNYPAMADQDYTVSYSTVSNPTVFVPLATVVYTPYPATQTQSFASASQVTLTNLTGAVGVEALQFSFVADGSQAGQMIREIDVDGTPTLATPEPSTWVLMGLGGFFLIWRLHRKRGHA